MCRDEKYCIIGYPRSELVINDWAVKANADVGVLKTGSFILGKKTQEKTIFSVKSVPTLSYSRLSEVRYHFL
jgi:hypothetical protein